MLDTTRPGGWGTSAEPIPAPLALHGLAVPPEWVDYNGHMGEAYYLLAIGESSDAFFRYIGINEAYRAAGSSLYTVETHMRHLDEAVLGDRMDGTLRVLGVDSKRVHIVHELSHGTTVLATCEQMLLHVDMTAGRSSAMPDELYQRLVAIVSVHAVLPVPDWVGRSIAIPR